MAPGWDNETHTVALTEDTDATVSGWFVVSSELADYQNTYREESGLLIMKKEKQEFGKPLASIGISLPIQKAAYLDHRRNSVRL